MPKYDYDLLLNSIGGGGIKALSNQSVAFCIMALGVINNPEHWQASGQPLSDTQRDIFDNDVSQAMDELMGGLVGMIVPVAIASPSITNMLLCDGSVHNKTDYPELYDVLDSTFIISGSQFFVPDLTDRFVAGAGAGYAVGDTGGQDSVALSVNELPNHSHTYQLPSFNVDVESVGVPDPTGVGLPSFPTQTSGTGGNQPHENRPPFIALSYYIIAR